MTHTNDTAFLTISPSPDGDSPTKQVPLTDDVTWLGRPAPTETRTLIDLKKIYISKYHATIRRIDATTYILKNEEGRLPIGIYDTKLKSGMSHRLRHGDTFRIPDDYEHDNIYWFQFLLRPDETMVGDGPLTIFPHATDTIYVFNQEIKIGGGYRFQFVKYLYENRRKLCTYETITHHLWPGSQGHDRMPAIEQLLVHVRAKFREAAGFEFIETVDGKGLRLLI